MYLPTGYHPMMFWGDQEVMLVKAAFLDYKNSTDNDKLRCKQRKRILFVLVWGFFHEICQVIFSSSPSMDNN